MVIPPNLNVEDYLTYYHTIPTFNNLEKEALWKDYGKGENAGNQHFIVFPLCFLPFAKEIFFFFFFGHLQMH